MVDVDELQNMIYMKTKISEVYNSEISSSKIFSISIKWLERGYAGLREYSFVTNAPLEYDTLVDIIKDNKDIKKILSIDVTPIDFFKKG